MKIIIIYRFCLSYVEAKLVRLGVTDLKQSAKDIEIESFIPHENYNSRDRVNDIAVIKLKELVNLNMHIRPACLPQSNENDARTLIASGWGLVEYGGSTSDHLLKVSLNVLDQRFCSGDYDKISEKQMCVGVLEGGKDTCNGGKLEV